MTRDKKAHLAALLERRQTLAAAKRMTECFLGTEPGKAEQRGRLARLMADGPDQAKLAERVAHA